MKTIVVIQEGETHIVHCYNAREFERALEVLTPLWIEGVIESYALEVSIESYASPVYELRNLA